MNMKFNRSIHSFNYQGEDVMEKTKKCKYCQTEIPKKAKVCPNCKQTLKSHGCLVGILIFLILIAVGIVVAVNMNDAVQQSISGVSSNSEYITMEEYNQIQTGMSYDEVKNIVGSEGELSSTSTVAGYTISIYTWYGNDLGANANVTFENDQVIGKAQVGL